MLFSLAWLVLVMGAWVVDPFYALIGLGGGIVVALAALKPIIPLYGMAVLYPFIHWELNAANLNAPLVDVIGVAALAAWIVRITWQKAVAPRQKLNLQFPAWPLFLGFIIIAAVSAYMSWDMAASFKYVARPLIFFYAVYVVFVVNTVRTKEQLQRLLATLYAVGILIALYGVYSFFAMNVPRFIDRRVVPVNIFGKNPLGANHNLVADVMITTIPIGLYLMTRATHHTTQKIIFLGVLLMAGVNLLTFSRSGWLAMLLEMVMLVLFYYRHNMKRVLKYAAAVLVIASPLVLALFFLFSQESFQSSNENRLILNDVAYEMFADRPLIGQGPGTFKSVLESTPLYIQLFGEPIDAHGFIQKVGSELGLLGLLCFLGLIGWMLYRVYQQLRARNTSNEWSIVLMSVFLMAVGSVFFQLFQTSYFISKMWLPIGVAVAAAAIASRKQHD